MKAILSFALAVLACRGAAFGQGILTDIGVMQDCSNSQAFGVSRDGLVVVGNCARTDGSRQIAFRWTAAHGFEDLGAFINDDVQYCRAQYVSDDGQVIAGLHGCGCDESQRVFRWTPATGPVDPGVPIGVELPGGVDLFGGGMSGDGSVIAGRAYTFYTGEGGTFRWSNNTGEVLYEYIPAMPGPLCVAHDGSAVFGSVDGGTVRLRGSLLEWLGPFDAYCSSDDGRVLAGEAHTSSTPYLYYPVRWTAEDGIVALPTFLYGGGGVSFISADGAVMLGSCDSQYCVWPASGGILSLNSYLQGFGVSLAEWANPVIEGMSGDATVLVGYGDHNGQRRGFVIRLRPTCGSADYNHDGDVGTDADIDAFFACLAGTCCAACGPADFNGDGDVGTDTDIEAFFRVLGGGSC